MCGIFGIITSQTREIGPTLVEAGRWLSYRGYDSVGCATIHSDGQIDLRKDVGKLEILNERFGFSRMQGCCGIIQLRWATFGAPSQANAQPHLDSDGDLVGAHNGNVVNNLELRKQFIAEGMVVRSTNDGESCVHAVEHYINLGRDLITATRLAYNDLAGDYAFVITQVNANYLCAVKKGTGLVIGLGEGANYVSSETSAILPFTRRILRVLDGELVTLWADRVEIRRTSDGALIERQAEVISESVEIAQKGGYAHFMLKEIHEQPKVAGELLHLLADSPDVLPLIERLQNARNLYLVGCGSSYNACLLGAVYLAGVAGRPAIPVLAPQLAPQYGPALRPGDVALFVSQSGETKDILTAEEMARYKGVHTLGLVNSIGSTLARLTERYLPLVCGAEISVPATKTFVNQAISLLYLALQLGDVPVSGLNLLPELLEQTIAQTEPQVLALKHLLSPYPEMYCLGYGATYPIAIEGALKIKEITYIHCEGMLSTEFKHGPLSAVQEDYPVLFVAGPGDIPLLVSGINEVACRGGKTIAIAEPDELLQANLHHLISLPQAGPLLNPILATLPLQLLAYHLAVERGLDADFPRNLTKTLTVD